MSQFTGLLTQNTNQAYHGQKPEGCPFFKSNCHVSTLYKERTRVVLFFHLITMNLMTLEKAERVVKGRRG